MKILHTVEFYYPSVGGAQEVVKQLSEYMVRAGHDVTVATTKLPERKRNIINGVKIVEFNISGNKVNGYKGNIKKYKDYLINSRFDIVMNYAAQQWATDLFFDVVDKIKAKKVIVPCGYSALYDSKYKHYFDLLPAILKKYNASIYNSNVYRDIVFARKHKLKNIYVIPNGASEKEFMNYSDDKQTAFRKKYQINNLFILTIGNHTGEKGHLEVLNSFALVPFTNATLGIVGKEYKNAGCYQLCQSKAKKINRYEKIFKKNVILFDIDRKETIDALRSADIFVFFSNIECSPLVLFESAASSTPFLTSSAGNSGEIAKWTKSGIVVRSKSAINGRVNVSIINAIVNLFILGLNVKKRKKMGRAGYINWKNKFTWQNISNQYLHIYKDLLKK